MFSNKIPLIKEGCLWLLENMIVIQISCKNFLILLSSLIVGWSCYFKAYCFTVLEFYFEVIYKSMLWAAEGSTDRVYYVVLAFVLLNFIDLRSWRVSWNVQSLTIQLIFFHSPSVIELLFPYLTVGSMFTSAWFKVFFEPTFLEN